MMWFSSVLLLVAFSGVMGQLEDLGEEFEECVKPFQELDAERLQELSGDEQMDTVCPTILEFFHCVDGVFAKEFESSLEEIAELLEGMVDEDVSKALNAAVNTKSMLKDLCTEGTQLNTDVKADMQCFESIEEEQLGIECERKAAFYDVFTDMSNEIEEADDNFVEDKACEESAFMAACLSVLVHEKCGQRAFNTMNTIIKRTTVFPNLICSREKLEKVKTSLIDRLDMPEAEKSLFKLALDLKRRRK